MNKKYLNFFVAACLLFVFPMSVKSQEEHLSVKVKSVYDGDTLVIDVPQHPQQMREVRVRVYGIDAPEKPSQSFLTTGKLGRSKCLKEAKDALVAKKFLEHLIKDNNNTVTLTDMQYDKFGSRIDAVVTVNGVNVAQEMLSKKMVVEYHGEKKTHNWCE